VNIKKLDQIFEILKSRPKRRL